MCLEEADWEKKRDTARSEILAALPGRLSPEDRMRFRVANSRKEYRAEWILPPQNFENHSQDVYGIRICPDNWEVEFYHSEEIIRPGP